MTSQVHKEGRSPFIFQADVLEDTEHEGSDDDMSDFKIRQSLSRSNSVFEEETQESIRELKALADAMAAEEETLPYVPESLPFDPMADSQPIESPYAASAATAPVDDGSDVEVVGSKAAAETPTLPPVNQLSLLLSMVKAKVAQTQFPGARMVFFAICVSLFRFLQR